MNELVLTGRRFITTIAATAGNVATNITVNDGETRLFMMSFRVTLVADATVATRNIEFRRQITASTTQLGNIMRGIDCTASNTSTFAGAGQVLATNSATSAYIGEGAVHAWRPEQYAVQTGWRLNITINNGVAGDSYSGVVEWLEVPA